MKLCIWMQSVLKAENVWWKLVLLLYDDLMVAFIPNASHIKAKLSLIFFPFFFFSACWNIIRHVHWMEYSEIKMKIYICKGTFTHKWPCSSVLHIILSRLYHGTFKSLLSGKSKNLNNNFHIFPKPLHNHNK